MKLYHYTTIDKLALILKYQSIRFNTAMKVDDPREADSFDLGKLGHYFLISCWTMAESESISMWKMYSDLKNGCIIKLDSEIFKQYGINTKIRKEKESIFKSSKVEIRPGMDFLIEVEYEKDYKKKQFYFPKPIDNISIDDYNIIKIKSEEWAFQKEWRYVLYQIPLPNLEIGYIENELIEKIGNLESYEFDHYDLEINNDDFKRMEIITAPLIDDGTKVIIENLCKEFNPNAKIFKSRCMIAI